MQPNDQAEHGWLTVAEVAAELGVKTGTVAKMCSDGRLWGSKEDPAREKSPWRVHRSHLDRYIARRDFERRTRGIVAAYRGPDGDAEFDAAMENTHGRDAMQQVRALRERHDLLQEAARAVSADADLKRAFEALDEDEIIERTAHEIAGRVRRQERIRNRAAQILAGDDDDHHAA